MCAHAGCVQGKGYKSDPLLTYGYTLEKRSAVGCVGDKADSEEGKRLRIDVMPALLDAAASTSGQGVLHRIPCRTGLAALSSKHPPRRDTASNSGQDSSSSTFK